MCGDIARQARRGSMELVNTVKSLHTHVSMGLEDEVDSSRAVLDKSSRSSSPATERTNNKEDVVVYDAYGSKHDANSSASDLFGTDSKFVVVDGLVTLASDEPSDDIPLVHSTCHRHARRGSIADRLIGNISRA